MTEHARIEILRDTRTVGAPFITIITPCYKRPLALARNRASVTAQLRTDIEQILVIDDVGRGWDWISKELALATRHARGQYIVCLDDDDELTEPGVIDDLAASLRELETLPDVIVTLCEIQYSFGPRIIVPEPEYWGKPPVKGHISGQCVILKRDVRMKHLQDFGADADGMVIDFPWMRAVFEPGNHYSVLWLPLVMSRMQFRGMGRTEEEMLAAERHPAAAGVS